MALTHSGASELAQLMEGATAGTLHELVRRGFRICWRLRSLRPLVPGAMNAVLMSAPPTARATASGCSPPRWAISAWSSPNCASGRFFADWHDPRFGVERLNKESKRRTNVVGICSNDAAIVRLVGAQLLEQQK